MSMCKSHSIFTCLSMITTLGYNTTYDARQAGYQGVDTYIETRCHIHLRVFPILIKDYCAVYILWSATWMHRQKPYTHFFIRNCLNFEPPAFLKNWPIWGLKISYEFLNFGSYLVIFIQNIKKIYIFFVFYWTSFWGSLKSRSEVS